MAGDFKEAFNYSEKEHLGEQLFGLARGNFLLISG